MFFLITSDVKDGNRDRVHYNDFFKKLGNLLFISTVKSSHIINIILKENFNNKF